MLGVPVSLTFSTDQCKLVVALVYLLFLLQEILLSDITHIEQSRNPQAVDASRNPHVFEIHLNNSLVYYIGEDPSWQGNDGEESAMVWVGGGISRFIFLAPRCLYSADDQSASVARTVFDVCVARQSGERGDVSRERCRSGAGHLLGERHTSGADASHAQVARRRHVR